jgi:hypothetical protein
VQFELCKLKVPVNAPLCAHPQMGTPVSNARDLLRALISEPTVAGWQWLVALLQEQIPPLPPKPQPPFPGAARGHSRQELERLAGLLQLKVDINTVGNGPANAQTVTVKISLRDLAPEFPDGALAPLSASSIRSRGEAISTSEPKRSHVRLSRASFGCTRPRGRPRAKRRTGLTWERSWPR